MTKDCVVVKGKSTVKDAITAIGQSLIERAEDIAKDVEKVSTINIYANIVNGEIVSFDVTKNYIAELVKEENNYE